MWLIIEWHLLCVNMHSHVIWWAVKRMWGTPLPLPAQLINSRIAFPCGVNEANDRGANSRSAYAWISVLRWHRRAGTSGRYRLGGDHIWKKNCDGQMHSCAYCRIAPLHNNSEDSKRVGEREHIPCHRRLCANGQLERWCTQIWLPEEGSRN